MPATTPLSASTVQDDTSRVPQVRVVVHTLGPAGPVTSDNHWSIYLLLPNTGGSVRINMKAEYENPTGMLEWTKQAYLLSISAVRYWDFQTIQHVTVGQIARLLYQNCRQNYDMSGGGSGCRWWV